MSEPKKVYAHHHIWCNHSHKDPNDCKMCEGLRASYPEDRSPEELIKLHFPNVVAR
jgi:hypothetical protein